jgi:cyanate lyase
MESTHDEATLAIKLTSTLRGVSYGDIARQTGIQRPFISHYIRRAINLTPDDANKILRFLELPQRIGDDQ